VPGFMIPATDAQFQSIANFTGVRSAAFTPQLPCQVPLRGCPSWARRRTRATSPPRPPCFLTDPLTDQVIGVPVVVLAEILLEVFVGYPIVAPRSVTSCKPWDPRWWLRTSTYCSPAAKCVRSMERVGMRIADSGKPEPHIQNLPPVGQFYVTRSVKQAFYR
jgi:hypothetical protein